MTLPNFRDCDKAPLEKVAKYVRGDTNLLIIQVGISGAEDTLFCNF